MKRTVPLKYVSVDDSDTDRAIRWNACQLIAKRIYRGTITTQKIVEVARESFEDNKEIKIAIKK